MKQNSWTNWGGNQLFEAEAIVRPETEDEAISAIQAAVKDGKPVRVAAGGHSFTPIVETRGILLDLAKLTGVISVDAAAKTAQVWAGSRIADLGEPLWNSGLSIANQGDIDVQSVAGAVATGTKGSGLGFGSMSSRVNGMRIVSGRGEVVDIDATMPEHLLAAQVAVGMLGPVLRIGLDLVPKYRLKEENVILPMAEVLRQWDHLLAEYRHFSFWWMPTDRSAQMYKLGEVPADHCFVKLLREVSTDLPDVPEGEINRRTDRAYRIYPDGTTVAEFHELEYMVGADRAREAVDIMRGLMLKRFPYEISPLQVRWQKADRGFISPQSGRDSTSISVSGEIGRNYDPFLRAVDEALRPLAARPHWGKLHFLDRERIRALYPNYDRFQSVRHEMDPQNLFLNRHLAELFA
ncbi:D-arabinono-1,4-lactone oxidase [Rhizobium multihospitium]|uniref:FAD/FMN-containing dehydrogenase n=1 Tax=Rhizobium multihospitium TaxID=410764 RepID=A0A1C3VWV2_9HYPH|nr:D-arabinono-1,4-lactone oxidase [Rhizobium multihospitium]SCB32249.1 FAD/FMN-containing dehydrogenase [Rhizobium multihospitium]